MTNSGDLDWDTDGLGQLTISTNGKEDYICIFLFSVYYDVSTS